MPCHRRLNLPSILTNRWLRANMYRDGWRIPQESFSRQWQKPRLTWHWSFTDRPPTVRAGRLDNPIPVLGDPKQSHGPISERSAAPTVTVTLPSYMQPIRGVGACNDIVLMGSSSLGCYQVMVCLCGFFSDFFFPACRLILDFVHG